MVTGWQTARGRKLPGKKETDVSGHSSRILQHLSPEGKSERPQMIAPEFSAGLRAPLQMLVPIGLRVVYPPAVVAAEAIWKTIDLDLALPALGGAVDQLHDELHHLLGRPLRRLVKLLHYRLLLFFLLLHVAQFLGGLCRLPLGHATA